MRSKEIEEDKREQCIRLREKTTYEINPKESYRTREKNACDEWDFRITLHEPLIFMVNKFTRSVAKSPQTIKSDPQVEYRIDTGRVVLVKSPLIVLGSRAGW